MAVERVTLYGVPLVTGRKVNFGRIDPPLSRELFIRHALVEGDWETHHAFFRDNRDLLAEVEELEHRARRRDILVDDETLFAFYDQRLPADVVSARHFDSWWKQARREQPDLLTFEKAMLVNERAGAVEAADYPDEWRQGELALRLTYQFEPGTGADGVTVHIPLPLLSRVRPEGFDRQVPGLREELVVALIRSLPKPVRRNFVPVPDYARAALDRMAPDGPLLDALERELRRMTGTPVPRDAWDLPKVPDHLRMTFRVEDESGATLAEGKDLTALQAQLRATVRERVTAAAPELTRHGLRAWEVGSLPRTVQQERAGYAVTAYPALVDEGEAVGVGVFESEAEQRYAMWQGTRRLLLLGLASPAKVMQGRLSNEDKLALSRNPHKSVADLLEDAAGAVVDQLMAAAGGPAWDEDGFAKLRDAVRAGYVDGLVAVVGQVRRVLAAAYQVEQRLKATTRLDLMPSLADARAQLSTLVYRGFVTATGQRRMPDLIRYLTAIERRLDRLPQNPQRDLQQTRVVEEIQREYTQLRQEMPPSDALHEIRWMIEELRINLFAQALGTAYPISEQRIYRAMDSL
jgi:ATP-dependent helicase HrpA